MGTVTKAEKAQKGGAIRRYLERNPQTKFIAPAMIAMYALSVIPTIFLVIISLTNYRLGWDFSRMKFVGLDVYKRQAKYWRRPFFCKWGSYWPGSGYRERTF